MADAPSEEQTDGQLLRGLRERSGLSLAQLAEAAHYDKGYLSRLENDRQPLSEAVAQACDRVLKTGGALTARAKATAARVARRDALPVAQLPAAPSALVGRAAQLTRVIELLTVHDRESGSVPVVCVDGPPGVGKTALALTCAHRIAGTFRGGALFADLRGYGGVGPANPAEVLDGFLRALGVHPNRIPSGLDERSGLFRSAVHGRKILIVLDNAGDSRQVRPLLPGSADCAVLVTSRQRLTGLLVASSSAAAVTVSPLGPDDARVLLRQVIGGRAAAEPAAVATVARRCAYLPLALRIAAVRMATYPHRTIADLADDLAVEHERLDVLSAAEPEVRGVFSWSYQALPAHAARMFRLLGVHPGTTFGTGAAAALAGLTESVAKRELDTLVTAHLVEETGRNRYRLHDLLRVYAAELMRAEDSGADYAAAVRRLVDWYLASVDAAMKTIAPQRPRIELTPPVEGVNPARFDGDYDRAMRWCDTELSSMVGVTRLAADHRLYDQAWQLPVRAIYYFLFRCPWDEWIAMHEIGIEAARAGDSTYGYGVCSSNLAEAHRRRGEWDIAERLFQEALAVCPEQYDRGWALAGLAFTQFDLGNYPTAAEYLHRMNDVFAEIDVVYGVATACAHLGDVYRELGDLDRAWYYGRRGCDLFVSMNDRQGQGYALPRLARTARRRGDHAAALALCAEAEAASHETGDRWGEADALEVRGLILRETGDERAAVDALTRALEIFEGLDDRRATRLRAHLRRADNP
ncbi:ATP-binding protein [Nocardia terpenica]|nr:tetratricopeptide repeat protein [Nocardia terpenica]NQE86086.1 tetratricopeptide repeat protein [Nocardia terpenica]